MSSWRPHCPQAYAVENYVWACPHYDPVLPRDCADCEHCHQTKPRKGRPSMPKGIPNKRTPESPAPPRRLDVTDTAAKLKDMGFVKVPEHLVSRGGRGGKFIGVQAVAGKPHRLTISRDLCAAAGLEVGMFVDPYYQGQQLALLVGYGGCRLGKHGQCLAFVCPLLLEKLGVAAKAQFPADCRDGVIFADLGGAEEATP